METQIFYWTGVVIWWCLCLMVIGGILTLAIITPIFIFTKSRWGWWRWVTAAKFAELGWSNEELKDIINKANITDMDFFESARRVIKAGK